MCRNCYVLIPSPPAFCGLVADKTKQQGEKSHHRDSPGLPLLPRCISPRDLSPSCFSHCQQAQRSRAVAAGCERRAAGFCPPACRCFPLIFRTLPMPHGKVVWRISGRYRACISFQNGRILHREALWKESKPCC